MKDRKLLRIVRDCLLEHYGIEGELERLPGENLNFLVTEAGGVKHVLKIVDDHLPPEVVEMEFEVLEHAAGHGFKPRLPRITETKYAKIETGINIPLKGNYRCRIIEFINGIGMSEKSDISIELLENLGQTIAEFNLIMRDFDHPAAHRNHRWKLTEAQQHEDKILLIGDRGKRDLLAWAFATWKAARPGLEDLPWQIIHGDAHDENILVAGDEVVGLIDFGDCCYNPTICELAICLTYLMMRGDPVTMAGAILRGYQAVRPLSGGELRVLYPLICGRLATTLCIANKRKTIDPDNPNWFGGEGRSWELLYRLRSRPIETWIRG